ncbi:M28 family metallopeptidase [Hyphococcus sp.]|uniref:M28 family metallopeptidase n=1 Tax=Hyphococcus sp. TaxID=2038636 RepID=UPI003CCBC5CC
MHFRRLAGFCVLAMVFSQATGAAAQTDEGAGAAAQTGANAGRLEADMRFLSDDLLEGRATGTRGYDLAAAYVAERYRALGFSPGGGDGTYYQQTPLLEVFSADADKASMRLSGRDAPRRFKRGEDYLVNPSYKDADVDIEAPVVFAGFGFVSEAHGRDDYEGLDVDGKIVAVFSGAPKFLNSEERAHYSSTRAERASERGAIGVLRVWTPALEERYAFSRAAARAGTGSSMTWIDARGEPFSRAENIIVSGNISLEGARKLLSNGPVPFDEILAAAESEAGNPPSFPLDVTARIRTQSVHERLESPNVVGVLPGSDPALKDEYVVLTAHLDHMGVRPTDEEGDDELYNGALDNGSGVASMLEVARLLALDPPRRSVIFIALTAEEKGLVGSEYFARNPTVPAQSIVANINLDMAILTYPFTDIVAFGGERSTMFPVVEAAAARAGLTLSPDPQPEQGFFTRSDQYSFVQEGVPALNIDLGWANGGQEAQETFLEEHYHQPSDEISLVNWDALRRFAQVNYEIARGVANMNERPLWKKGDFFAETFGGPMEE